MPRVVGDGGIRAVKGEVHEGSVHGKRTRKAAELGGEAAFIVGSDKGVIHGVAAGEHTDLESKAVVQGELDFFSALSPTEGNEERRGRRHRCDGSLWPNKPSKVAMPQATAAWEGVRTLWLIAAALRSKC